ncbi:MAG TPA: glutathione S-transferase family protein [Steroidobacteraceae bacterium]|jgi:glutathione S-transferase|nr:glutathione S-transferase family protein [Steroidobacteraceae bacterium]
MAIDFYWGSGSPPCWRVAMALEYKGLPYNSHLLHFDRQEHKSPQMLAMNFRGKLPVLRDGDYVVFESLAILYYLDQKYPDPPIFGRTPDEAGVIMRVICEYLSYVEPPLTQVVQSLTAQERAPERGPERRQDDAVTDAMHRVAGEARSIEMRLAHSDWVVGESFSAADMMIYPNIRLLLRMLQRPQAHELAARFLPMEVNYPAIGRWLERVAALPGHERTWPPHWQR